MSRLVSTQLTGHDHKKHICDRCLNYFKNEKVLKRHSKICVNEHQIEMPDEDNNWIEFKNHENKLKVPFIVYADIESFLKRLNEEEQNRVFSEACSTSAYQEHIAYSVGYYFKCEFDDSLSHYRSSGNSLDCIGWFIDELEKISKSVAEQMSKNKPMEKLSSEEEYVFNHPEAACFICERKFCFNERRVHDHCHFTGKYRGPAHNSCNLRYKHKRVIPVIMHNLSGYDAHLFITKLSTRIKGDVTIIPNNSEQYIGFTKIVNSTAIPGNYSYNTMIKLKFIDSCRFMPASLSELASLIPSDKKRILYSCLDDYSLEQLAMLERKGVFPYDYVDSFERLQETSLPSKKHFYSELNEDEIDDDEYKFALQVWRKFNIKTLGEYSELYLKTDVLLLADVFENFRDTSHNIYKLDPAHYYTAPGLSFDAMLKYTGVEIELLTDVEMLLFIENGIRGGISQVSRRYAKANNKYMKADFDPNAKSKFLMYLDGELTSFVRSFI